MVDLEKEDDLHCFEDEFKKLVKKCKETFLMNNEDVIKPAQWSDNAVEIIHKQIAGCCAQCPFCKEQCEALSKDHEGNDHSCLLHRPKCLGGTRFQDSLVMIFALTRWIQTKKIIYQFRHK